MPEADPELDVPESPVMWNGKEYWKVAGLESRVISKPYVAKLGTVLGIAQLYWPAVLAIPAGPTLAGVLGSLNIFMHL